MKLIKKASGKTKIRMSKAEWQGIGRKAGWLKKANDNYRESFTVKTRSGETEVMIGAPLYAEFGIDFEVYFPDVDMGGDGAPSDQVIRISEDVNDAKKTGEFIKSNAAMAKDVNDLYYKTERFVHSLLGF